MSHIVILCPAAHGHIDPLACLGRELQAGGHRVTMPQLLDIEVTVARTGLKYFPQGRKGISPADGCRVSRPGLAVCTGRPRRVTHSRLLHSLSLRRCAMPRTYRTSSRIW